MFAAGVATSDDLAFRDGGLELDTSADVRETFAARAFSSK